MLSRAPGERLMGTGTSRQRLTLIYQAVVSPAWGSSFCRSAGSCKDTGTHRLSDCYSPHSQKHTCRDAETTTFIFRVFMNTLQTIHLFWKYSQFGVCTILKVSSAHHRWAFFFIFYDMFYIMLLQHNLHCECDIEIMISWFFFDRMLQKYKIHLIYLLTTMDKI